MIQFILGFLTTLLAVFLFTKIRGFIFNRAKSDLVKGYKAMGKESEKIAKETYSAQLKALNLTEGLNASIGKSYPKGKEPFSWTKFKKIFDLGSLVEWVKSLKELGILDARKWVIIGVIVGGVYGYAYFQGRLNAPVRVNMSYDKEWIMNLNGEEIYKPKFSNDVFVRDSKTKEVLKQIKAKDMGLLRKKLKPIGFCLDPIFIAGGSVGGTESKGEVGIGASFIKFWRWNLEAFFTSYPALYVGTSYSITENSGAGAGVGKGVDGSNRVILYYKWGF